MAVKLTLEPTHGIEINKKMFKILNTQKCMGPKNLRKIQKNFINFFWGVKKSDLNF